MTTSSQMRAPDALDRERQIFRQPVPAQEDAAQATTMREAITISTMRCGWSQPQGPLAGATTLTTETAINGVPREAPACRGAPSARRGR